MIICVFADTHTVYLVAITCLIIYMTKLLDSDWLRKECKMCNTSAKSVIQCKLHIEILDYDWLMNNRVWSGPVKSFIFKSSALPGWAIHGVILP